MDRVRPFEWGETEYDSHEDCWFVQGSSASVDAEGVTHISLESINLSPLRTARERLAAGEIPASLRGIVYALLQDQGIK